MLRDTLQRLLERLEALPAPLAGFLKYNLPPLALVLIVLAVNTYIVEPRRFREKAAESKQSLHAIQLALERFSVDSPRSAYPASIAELQQAGYMPRLPINPFTGAPMRAYGIGDDAPLGDFVYFPRYEHGGAEPSGYTLAVGNAAHVRDWQAREIDRAALAAQAK